MKNEFYIIEEKLSQFTKKYYSNELLKGIIMFLSLGLIYFFFTLFIEYFLWLQPVFRTVLFWLFVLVELSLFSKFILFPIFKLIGLQSGISIEESSKIIGKHFPQVDDKLLNIIQLNKNNQQSELLLASIAQKSKELQPIPFNKAIDLKKNIKYLKYAIIPLAIYVLSLLANLVPEITNSFNRVVDYKTAYTPPAPFSIQLQNKNLKVIQGKDITISATTIGTLVPEEAKIIFDNQQYYVNYQNREFSYTFKDVQQPISFYIQANNVQSETYTIHLIGTPTISNINLEVNYPKYLNKSKEVLQNNANVILPEGTEITWKAKTHQTNILTFKEQEKEVLFSIIDSNTFVHKKRIKNSFSYQISSSNKNLKNYENLQFSVTAIQDEVPQISVTSDIDSIRRGNAQFAGQISDDYGLLKLQLVYYVKENPTIKNKVPISISKENIQTFYYQFPDNISLEKGIDYELYFQVYDNDGFNGSKSAKSNSFTYKQKTDEELEQELLQEQRNTINELENSLQNQKNQQEKLEGLQLEFQNKKDLNWNDKKKVDQFVKRQEQYKQMMQRQTEKLQENLDEIEESDESLSEKQEDLKQRIQELKKLEKQQRLLDEIQKMADKLNKEDLVEKAKELTQQNKQQQRSLEKTLEMVKRFYVEQKTMQIANKINELSKKQQNLSDQDKNTGKDQKAITSEFDEIKKEIAQLKEDNEKLKEPIDLPDVEQEKEEISKSLNKTAEELINQELTKAKQSQKRVSKKMQEMSKKMQQAMMDMQGETMEENIDDLRKILENLIIFSFEQEQLMNQFDEISTSHPNFGKSLKRQNEIKTYFNHIDDSLYVLSMRVPRISNMIQDDLSSIHYNLDQSLDNFSENRFSRGTSNQRYVMTSTNNLADYLSNTLNSMQNNMAMKMGKGKNSNQNSFSLPDLIEKQKGLSEKMKKGLQNQQEKGKDKNGKQKGKNGNSSDNLDGELYEIFKEQNQLRQELQNAIKQSENSNNAVNGNARKVLKSMEELENEILEKGFNSQTLQQMQQLNYELLKLDTAKLKQGQDKNRKSSTNLLQQKRSNVKVLKFKKQFYNQIEILNRQSLPLQQIYKTKVRAYFSDKSKK